MATAADIGANSSNYVGDKVLGGFTSPVFNIDTKPLMQLAAYTFQYNEDKWRQDQKDMEAAAKEMAAMTSYNLSNTIPKFSKIVRDKYDQFYNYVQQNPNVLDYKKNPKQYLEYKKKKTEFENDLSDAQAQDIIYKVRQKKIDAAPTAELKAYYKGELDKDVAAADLRTPLKHDQNWNVAEPEFKAPNQVVFDVGIIGSDANANRSVKKLDIRNMKLQASAISNGLIGEILDESTAEFQALSEDAKNYKRGEAQAKRAAGRLALVSQSETYNKALPTYRDESGNLDTEKIKSSNPLLAGVIDNIESYNKYISNEKEQIKAGAYRDKGQVLQFGMGNLKEYDYQEINWKDGISPEELATVKLFGMAPTDSYETKVTPTDNSIQREQMANALKISRENNSSQERIAAANREAKKAGISEDGIIGTNSVLAEIASIINKGEKGAAKIGFNIFGSNKNLGNTPDIFTISDPTILKEFTNVDEAKPTSVKYNKKTDEFILTFAGGDGESDKEQKIDGRTYVKSKIKQTYPNKDIGDINNYVTRLYDQEGSLYNISKMYDKEETKTSKPSSTDKKMSDAEYEEFLQKNGLK